MGSFGLEEASVESVVSEIKETFKELRQQLAHERAVKAELLEALKVTLNYWKSTGFAECEPDCDCIVESVRKAIAHAEGSPT